MDSSCTQTGVLVLRVWLEPGEPASLRARISSRLDVAHDESRRLVAGSTDAIARIVVDWVEEFVATCGQRGAR